MEAGIFAAWQIPMMTGIRQATVPVFEETEDSTQVTIMIAAINGSSLVPAFFTTAIPIASARPSLKHSSADDEHTAEENDGGIWRDLRKPV